MSESSEDSKVKEGELTKEQELTEEDLEYESNSSYQAPPMGSEVMTLVPIEEEDEVHPLGFWQCYSADHGDIRLPPFLKRTKFLFRWVSLIVLLLYLINTPFTMQVPFHPIHITSIDTSWTRTIRFPVLGISSTTSKSYANKVVQARVESRMREYGYSSVLDVAPDVAEQIRSIGGTSRSRGDCGAVSSLEYSPGYILPGLDR